MAVHEVSKRTAAFVIAVVVLAVLVVGAWSILGDRFAKVSEKEAIEQGRKEADAMEQSYRERLPKKRVPAKSSPSTAAR